MSSLQLSQMKFVTSTTRGFHENVPNKSTLANILKHLIFVGQGSYGEVYTICLPGFQSKVLKIVYLPTETDRILFRQEYGLLEYLNKRGLKSVVKLFGYAETKRHGYLLMEKLDETPSQKRNYKVSKQAYVEALKAIHDCGVLHRDIKLDNIMFRDGLPVFIDFGRSKRISPTNYTQKNKDYEMNRLIKLIS